MALSRFKFAAETPTRRKRRKPSAHDTPTVHAISETDDDEEEEEDVLLPETPTLPENEVSTPQCCTHLLLIRWCGDGGGVGQHQHWKLVAKVAAMFWYGLRRVSQTSRVDFVLQGGGARARLHCPFPNKVVVSSSGSESDGQRCALSIARVWPTTP